MNGVTNLEKQLTLFRESYHSVKCMVYQDYIIYRCAHGHSDKAALVANNLIERLGLDLVAISTTLPGKSSYEIKSLYNSDL